MIGKNTYKTVFLFVFVLTFAGLLLSQDATSENPVNINAQTCEELQKLPLNEEQFEAICREIKYGSGFESVYELLDLGVFTPEEFQNLKPLVVISKTQGGDDPAARVDNLYFRISSWLSGEDVSTAAIDDWVDAIVQEPTLFELDYRDLVGMQNVSPQDAFALLKHRNTLGIIKSRRQLKGVDNLSIQGYISVRNYIGYGESKGIWGQNGYFTSRFSGAEGEAYPYMHMRGRYSFGPISAGVRLQRDDMQKLEDGWINPASYPAAKYYAALSRYDLGDFKIRRAVVGDYTVSFGEGVTIGTYDWFTSRNTGTGWSVRQLGINPDISSTTAYGLRGFGLETAYKMFEPTVFISSANKPVLLNSDSLTFSEIVANVAPWEDEVKENLFGADLTIQPIHNARLGFTYYRANYDKPWSMDPATIVTEEYLPWGENPKTDERDAELFNTTYEQDYRSAMGIHGVFNLGNLTLSGEYSEIVRDENVEFNLNRSGLIDTVFGDATSPMPIGDDPYGLVLKSQLILNRFSLQAIYRHYDIGFDNPYNRGFSNYYRYKGSIVEKDYRLTNPALMDIAELNPRPQAEDGFYFTFFGRVSRQLYGTVEFDAFTRLTDMAEYRRIVLKANYRPNGKVMIKLWRKWQGRAASNGISFMGFEVDETRLTVSSRLSDYSTLDFQIVHSYYQSSPRPSFTASGDPMDDDSAPGSAVDPSNGLMLGYDIELSERLDMKGQAIIYKGWLWNFENNDFAVLESDTDALRLWFAINDRLAKNLSATFKMSFDTPLTSNNIDLRDDYNPDPTIEGGSVKNANTTWLLQLDYFF